MVVIPGVRRVLAPNPSPMTGPGTNTYLVGAEDLAVVDPGPDIPEHVDAILSAAGNLGGRIVASLVTHAHRDHLPAAYRLRARSGVPIFGHRDLPDVDNALNDGDEMRAGSFRLVALDTPGHADAHLCFWNEANRLLFTGDLIAGAGTVVLADTPGSLSRYRASLHRVEDLGPSIVLPGHGPIVPDGLAKIREYLSHRAERDQQILDTLRSGPATADSLVRRLYVDTPPTLFPMAERNVRAHLEWLAGLGRVQQDGETWSLRRQT